MIHDEPSAETPPGDRLDRLIHGHLDGSLATDGMVELEGFLRDSAAARARFWDLAEVDGLGRDAARLAWGETASGSHDSRRRASVSRSSAAIVGAVLTAVAAAVWVVGTVAFDRADDAAALKAKTAEDDAVSPPPLATVTKTRFLVTAEGEVPLAAGQPLAAGRLSLLGGAVELTLRNGVVITLEGPAEMDLAGDLAAFLHDGRVVVRMPEGTDGFRLETACADLLDLGTEFAVKASRSSFTEVQVYEGAVLATGRSGDPAGRFPRRLEEGQSARFVPYGQREPEPIPYSESRFVRRLPAEPGVPFTPHIQNAVDPAAALRLWGRPQCDAIVVHRAPQPVEIDGRLDDWRDGPGFLSFRDGTPACPEWADGRMMHDDERLYIAAHVGDPEPLRSVIDPAIDPGDGWRGGSVQVRLSTDRAMGWPADGDTAAYYSQRQRAATAAQREAACNPRLLHLTLWYHAASRTPCLTIQSGMLDGDMVVNPVGFRAAYARDADGKGYVLEYAIPWRLLICGDDPPRAGDRLAAVWQVNWSDTQGRMRREHMVEIRNPHEPLQINVWERAATWGRAEYR
jgi:hypothetical protein